MTYNHKILNFISLNSYAYLLDLNHKPTYILDIIQVDRFIKSRNKNIFAILIDDSLSSHANSIIRSIFTYLTSNSLQPTSSILSRNLYFLAHTLYTPFYDYILTHPDAIIIIDKSFIKHNFHNKFIELLNL